MSDSDDEAAGWGCGCLLLPFVIGLILYVCYVIICCSLLVAGVVLAFSGLLGLVWGITKTSWNFGCSVKNNLLYRSGLVEDNAYVKAQGGDTNYTGSNGSYGVLSLTYKR